MTTKTKIKTELEVEAGQWSIKYRPTSIDDMLLPAAVSARLKKVNETPPAALLLAGDFGNGKTTLALIIANMLTTYASDIIEIDGANDTGIDNIRNLVRTASFKPRGKRRVFIIDEAHALSPQAVKALLKPTETTKPVTWILCSSNPEKINKALLTRCTRFDLMFPLEDVVFEFLDEILEKEKIKSLPVIRNNKKYFEKIKNGVIQASINLSNGSLRMALNNLQNLFNILAGLDSSVTPKEIITTINEAIPHERLYNENIITLLKSDPAAAAAALLSNKGSLFNEIFYVARDSVADYQQDTFMVFVLNQCLEAYRWAALTNLDPSIYLSAKLAKLPKEKEEE